MKKLCIAILLGSLAACAGQRPKVPAAAMVVPPAGWREANDGNSRVVGEWWQAFGDPTLSTIVAQALASNVDLASAATRVEQARAQFRIAQGQLLPSVGGKWGGQRERYLDPFGRAASDTAQQGEIDISYDLDLFGRLRSTREAARASLLASQAASDALRLAVVASTVSGYVNLRVLDARITVVRETVEARLNSLKVARRRAQSGYATQLELDQAEAELYATEQLIPALELAIATQEDGLSILLGDNPHRIERGVPLADLTVPSAPSLLPAELLRRRPDVAQSEQQLVAADRSLDAARAAFMPHVDLGLSGGYSYSTLVSNPVGIFAVGGSILAPLYEGGRLHAQADASAARRDEAAFAYRRTALNAFREVEDALSAVRRSGEQELTLRNERDALARALVQATNRYRAGYSSYLEQLDAQRGLLSAELSLAQSNGDRLNASVSLFRALGGGWSADGLERSFGQPKQGSVSDLKANGANTIFARVVPSSDGPQ